MEENRDKTTERIKQLKMEIYLWSSSNSQSNPGAYFHLRDMKKELKKLEESAK
jgi:hypothetical protein